MPRRAALPITRLFGRLALAALAAVIWFSAPAPGRAQSAPPPWERPIAPQRVAPPALAYRPPATAREPLALAPPGATVVSAASDLAGRQTALVEPTGDRVVQFDGGRVSVFVAAGTFGGPVRFEFAPGAAVPGRNEVARFTLTAVDAASDKPLHDFPRPVRLIIDLRSGGGAGPPVSLTIRDGADSGFWRGLPARTFGAGLLAVDVLGVGEMAATAAPEPWTPVWTPPTAAAFSGAATYSYPLETPPGRRGLGPAVALSYISRGLDGRIHDLGHTTVAHGWSLAEIAVHRVGVKSYPAYGALNIEHPDQFNLVLNGSAHRLIPAGDPLADVAVYYAENNPGLRVRRYFDSAALNSDKLFWSVTTPDGTHYRLGYTADAEVWQQSGFGAVLYVGGHPGLTSGDNAQISALAWYVDTVTDVFGNQVQYAYNTHVDDAEPALVTHKNRLATIGYNFPDRVPDAALPPGPHVPRLATTPATRLVFQGADEAAGGAAVVGPMASIFTYHGDPTTPAREVRLTTEDHFYESPGCLIYDVPPGQTYYPPRVTGTRVLTAIQVWAGTDGDAGTADPGYALPPTTFDYSPQAHFEKNGQACFRFAYLTAVYNGYGATSTFSYASDDRAAGGYVHHGAADYQFPDIGYSLFVTAVAHDGGVAPATQTTISYAEPCYAQSDGTRVGTLPGATTCWTDDDPADVGALTGFAERTAVHLGYAGEQLGREVARFSLATAGPGGSTNGLLGRVVWRQRYDADDVLIGLDEFTYNHTAVAGGLTHYLHVASEKTTHFQGGVGSNTLATRVDYGYEQSFQGGAQYGNPTVTWQHGDLSSAHDDRTRVRCYYPNVLGDTWLPGLLAKERVFEGLLDVSTAPLCSTSYTTNLLNETLNTYDNNSFAGEMPLRGALTQVRVGRYLAPLDGGVDGHIVQARLTYDAFGNVLTTTDANDGVTTTLYDAAYNLYPVRVMNALGHVSEFDRLGFPDAAGALVAVYDVDDARQPAGGLYRVRDVDNGRTTSYEYDPFGRFATVYDPGDDRGALSDGWDGEPRTRTRYWDNNWNSPFAQHLNPAGGDPFLITTQTRPNEITIAVDGYQLRRYQYYDGFGRAIQTQTPGMPVTDENGVEAWLDVISTTAYDARGAVACETVPYAAPLYVNRLPGPGQPATAYLAGACSDRAHTATTYDAQGRTAAVTTPDGVTTHTSYYLMPNTTVGGQTATLLRTRTVNGADQLKHSFTDAAGQLWMVRTYTGDGGAAPYQEYNETQYGYDARGNLTSVRTYDVAHQLLRESTMSHDVLGRKKAMIDADMGVWSYDYDAVGNLVRQAPGGQIGQCFYYDRLNRPVRKVLTTGSTAVCPALEDAPVDGPNHVATYVHDTATNGVGQAAVTSWGPSPAENHDTFAYDAWGRLTERTRRLENRPFALTIAAYDVINRPVALIFPDGESVAVTYDPGGEETLTAGADTLVEGVRHNVRGQVRRLSRGNGTTTEYSFFAAMGPGGNANYRLDRALTVQSYGGALLDFTYDYDVMGNITQISEGTAGDIQTFAYDDLNRILSAAGAGPAPYNVGFNYDPLGNIIAREDYVTGRSRIYNYGAWAPGGFPEQPHAVKELYEVTSGGRTSAQSLVASFVYDTRGNMKTRMIDGRTYDHSFDALNRLVSVTIDGVTTSFGYADGERRTMTERLLPDGRRAVTYYPFAQYEVDEVQSWQCDGANCAWQVDTSTARTIYRAAGQTIAQRRVSLALDEDFAGGAVGWDVVSGGWSVVSNPGSTYYAYFQADSQGSNRRSRLSLAQSGRQIYTWTGAYVAGRGRNFGLYLMAQESAGLHFGHSYLVAQVGDEVKIYESVNNQLLLRQSASAPSQLAGPHTYTATYDPAMGLLEVFRDGAYVTGWQDATPLTAGSYIALRTDKTGAVFEQVGVQSMALHYVHGDHLGSTVLLSDESGQAVTGSAARYLPFGDYRGPAPNPGLTELGFTGHHENRDLGLTYMNARFYVPAIGRFASADTIVPDPADPASLNRYSYVRNNPLTHRDPSGHCGEDTESPAVVSGTIIRFDCSLAEFDAMSISERLAWLRLFVQQTGSDGWFDNIIGILESFAYNNLAQSGSFLSIVDAAILQGIQNGYARHSNQQHINGGNSGAPLWKTFFDALAEQDRTEEALLQLWGNAEQETTKFGVLVALSRGLFPDSHEIMFLAVGTVYREMLQHSPATAASILGAVGSFFDVVAGTANGASVMTDLGVTLMSPNGMIGNHSPVYWVTNVIWAIGSDEE